MHLKELELVGFKSFADKTSLKFDRGLSVIVGPNGCGKSNVFDAIRWALGEQSMKSLRGNKTEDVIFGGTEKRPPANFAEVSLIFSNENSFFHLEADEVVITRRLYRTGETQYFINRAQVRLKDIYELMRGTGIGPDAYSLVEQGKIDLIFSLKPEDRRVIFDEASGVIKYKARRKETQSKLRSTEENLQRVNDILSEVKRQMTSLERQAQRAKRYRELYQELCAQEEKLLVYFLKEDERKLQELLKEKDSLEKEIEEKNSEYHQRSHKKQELEKDISSLQEEAQRVYTQIEVLNTQIQENENLKKVMENNIQQLHQNLGYLDSQYRTLEEELSSLRVNLDDMQKKSEELKGLMQDKENKLRQNSAYIDELKKKIQEGNQKIKSLKEKILEFTSQSTSFNNQMLDIQGTLKVLESRHKRLTLDSQKLDLSLSQVTERLSSFSNSLKQNKECLSQKVKEEERILEELASLRKESEKVEEELYQKDKEKVSILTEKNIIENLKFSFADFKDTAESKITFNLDLDVRDVDFILSRIKEIKKLNGSLEIFADSKILRHQKERLQEKLSSLESTINTLNERLKNLGIRQRDIQGSLKEISHQKQVIEEKINNDSQEFFSLDRQRQELVKEQEVINFELEEVKSHIDKNNADLKAVLSRKEELKTLLESSQREIEQLQHKIHFSQEEINKTLIANTQLQTEIENLKEQELSLAQQNKLLSKAYLEKSENLKSLQEKKDGTESRLASWRKNLESLEEKAKQHLIQLEEGKGVLEEKRRRLESLQSEFNALVKSEEGFLNSINVIKERLHKLDMQVKEIEFHSRSLRERFLEVYQKEPDFGVDISGLEPEKAQGIVDDLRRRLKYIGQVDDSSISEYESLRERFEFLDKQRQDLEEAKKKLSQAIIKINRVSKQIFIETFQKIQEEFKNYFQILFGPGQARIILTNEDDPLESGIDIYVRPPGKKLQSVTLLSGGEKALSAIALLFAIFKVRPAPFAILDEIDAPLDEANIERFSQILVDFSRHSQFILISHNKRTISKADIIYGVTMEETGVSRIVSVKFIDASATGSKR